MHGKLRGPSSAAASHSDRANRRSRWWVCLVVLAVSCTTTHTSPTPTRPPVAAAGTWRNVTKVFLVPPGDLSVTLRETGTGFLEMPDHYSERRRGKNLT